jgi:hypothetical protein
MQVLRRENGVIAEAPIRRKADFSRSHAKLGAAFFAETAHPAGIHRIKGYPLPDSGELRPFAQSDHTPDRFVAQDHTVERTIHQPFYDRVVTRTHAVGDNFHQGLARAWPWHRAALQADAPYIFPDDRSHGFAGW